MNNSPFKFLDSYTKEDKDIFFGRENEIEKLYSLVFESKTMLIYGVSGTGKSSLIHCGLANKFNEADWLPINIRRGTDMLESFWTALEKTALTPLKKQEKLTAVKFKKAIQSIYLDHFKPIFFIFDQFEELFVFGSEEEQKEFLAIIKSITESDLQARFVFVIREEYLAWFTEFESEIPTILDNRLRIEKMTRENARQAIEGPCQLFNIEVEEEFAQTLLQKLSPQQNQVELTYLQVYLDKLYRMAQAEVGEDEQLQFTKSLIDQSGNISDLLGSFLEEQIAQLEDPTAGLKVLKAFVSTKGTKRQINIEEAQNYIKTLGADLPQEHISKLITQFVNLRILRDKDEANRFELRHDALAAKIFEKITLAEKELLDIRLFVEHAYDNYQKREILLSQEDLDYVQPFLSKLFLEKKQKDFLGESKRELLKAIRRKRTIILSATLVLIAILVGFSWWAISERNKAKQISIKAQNKEVEFKALYFNGLSKDIMGDNPTQAFRIAEYAHSLDTNNRDIHQNMLDIYYSNSLITTYPGQKINQPKKGCYSVKHESFSIIEEDVCKIYNMDTILCEIKLEDKEYGASDFHPINPELWMIIEENDRIFIETYSIYSGIRLDKLSLSDVGLGEDSEIYFKNLNGISITISPKGNYLTIYNARYETSLVVDIKASFSVEFKGELYFSNNEKHILIDDFLIEWNSKRKLKELSNVLFIDKACRNILIEENDSSLRVIDFNGKTVISGIKKTIDFNNKNHLIWYDFESNIRFYCDIFRSNQVSLLGINNEIIEVISLPSTWMKDSNTLSNIFKINNNFFYQYHVNSLWLDDTKLYNHTLNLSNSLYNIDQFKISKNGEYILCLRKNRLIIYNKFLEKINTIDFPQVSSRFEMDISNLGKVIVFDYEGLCYVNSQNKWELYNFNNANDKIQQVQLDIENGFVYGTTISNNKVFDTVIDYTRMDQINQWTLKGELISFQAKDGRGIFGESMSLSNSKILFSHDEAYLLNGKIERSFIGETHMFFINTVFSDSYRTYNNILELQYPILNKDDQSFTIYNRKKALVLTYEWSGELISKQKLDLDLQHPINMMVNYKRSINYICDLYNWYEVDKHGYIHNRSLGGGSHQAVCREPFIYFVKEDRLIQKRLKPALNENLRKYLCDPMDISFVLENEIYSSKELLLMTNIYSLEDQLHYYFQNYSSIDNQGTLKEYISNVENILFQENLSEKYFYLYINMVSSLNDYSYLYNQLKNIVNNTSFKFSKRMSVSASSFSYNAIESGNFKDALLLAKLAKDLNSRNNVLYTNLALSYLLTNDWESAKEVYETYQDSTYNDRGTSSCKQGFLEDIDELERLGIIHADFQKVRELLGAIKVESGNKNRIK